VAAADDSPSAPAAVPYFTIRPADAPLDPATVETTLRRLHVVLAALNEPLDGEMRVEKTYAETSPVTSFKIDEPGLTAMYTVE
jgi:hypothetical protein